MTPKHDIKDTYDDVNSSMHSKNENKKEVTNLRKQVEKHSRAEKNIWNPQNPTTNIE